MNDVATCGVATVTLFSPIEANSVTHITTPTEPHTQTAPQDEHISSVHISTPIEPIVPFPLNETPHGEPQGELTGPARAGGLDGLLNQQVPLFKIDFYLVAFFYRQLFSAHI